MTTRTESGKSESEFLKRHLGPRDRDVRTMLKEMNLSSVEKLIEESIPATIRHPVGLSSKIPKALTEQEWLDRAKETANKNVVAKSYLGQGYYRSITPAVIARNILENPAWYTQYTPYQSEISQGRLEALVNFQTMVVDLTGMEVANASLLDEATAAGEAMTMSLSVSKSSSKKYFVSSSCHPQTIDVLKTRAKPLGIELVVGAKVSDCFGALLQYPDTFGTVNDLSSVVAEVKKRGGVVTVASDLLALCLLKSPGDFGADIVVGSSQRFGVPLGFGGPHAAFLATRSEFQRKIPGRIVGVSKDAEGRPAYRLALQTREQHIRRDKATSNICTAQVLLAIMASMYAVYHGPQGLRRIARNVHGRTVRLAAALKCSGQELVSDSFFDTIIVRMDESDRDRLIEKAAGAGLNLRSLDEGIGISLDEATTEADLKELGDVLGVDVSDDNDQLGFSKDFEREQDYLSHPVFQSYHSETEMLRYMKRLESRDLSLATSMIPLGSCTMKLNAAAEMLPISWSEFSGVHPFAPEDQVQGYLEMIRELEDLLCQATGFSAISLQPNAGSQGEYAGLLAIQQYHVSRGDEGRNICLIPKSAHGTNPASAVLAGLKVVAVECDSDGNVDLKDLKEKAKTHEKSLAALMITYPSTHGVYEEGIQEICQIVHDHGGQVYMDGANLNALIGYCSPPSFGADVCHLNLHKTFAIPHGGGGPGIGPIGVKEHLKPFLPGHRLMNRKEGAVAAAPWGSAGVLPISWGYIRLLGGEGLKRVTEVAILNANYIAHRLEPHFPVLYKGQKGRVAHECIVDLRPLKAQSGIEVEDVAKRLMDYGFHAPTVSFPVAGTLMIEPTESESLAELDRFCEAMISIRAEIQEVIDEKMPRDNNLLKNAPHPASCLVVEKWERPYSRDRAVYPTQATRDYKFWPPVSRIDNVYGDRNLFCTCPEW